MGRVTPYQQRQLESSLVGTPGVDNSGSILAGAMANSQSRLASASNAVNANANRQMEALGNFAMANFEQEMRTARHVKRQAELAQQKYNADTEVANTGTQLASRMVDLEARTRKEFATDPNAGIEEFKSRAEDLRDEIIGSAGSDQARLALRKDFGTKFDTAVQRMSNWALEQDTIVGFNKLNSNAVAVRGTLEGVPVGDIDMARKHLDQWQADNNSAIGMYYGKGAADFIVKTKTDAMKGMLSRWSEEQPGYIHQLKEQGKLHTLVYQDDARSLLAQDRTNMNILEETRKDEAVKAHLSDSFKVEELRKYISQNAESNMPESVKGVKQLYELLDKQQRLPQEQRDLQFERYLNGTIQSALANNQRLRNTLITQLRDDVNYNRLVAIDEQVFENKQRADVRQQEEDLYRSDESVAIRRDIMVELDNMKSALNNASKGDVVGSSGVNGRSLQALQKRIVQAFNDKRLSESDMRGYTEKVSTLADAIYDQNKDKNSFFSMFLDHSSSGPSDNLLRAVGVPRTGADGKPSMEYLQLKDAVDKKLQEAIKRQNIPPGAILNPAAKNAMWANAQFEVLKDYVGTRQAINSMSVKPKAEAKPPAFNPSAARQAATTTLYGGVSSPVSGKKAKTSSGFVPPPPPSAPIMDRNTLLQMRAMYQANLAELNAQLGEQ